MIYSRLIPYSFEWVQILELEFQSTERKLFDVETLVTFYLSLLFFQTLDLN